MCKNKSLTRLKSSWNIANKLGLILGSLLIVKKSTVRGWKKKNQIQIQKADSVENSIVNIIFIFSSRREDGNGHEHHRFEKDHSGTSNKAT